MIKNLTCIGCPMGCQLTVELQNGAVTSVSGNTCKKGEDYARKECVAPMRTVTGTVRLSDGRILPVRTAGDVPKESVFAVAAALNTVHPAAPLAIGDVVIANVCDTGVDIIATKAASRK